MPDTAIFKSRELGPETFIPYVRHVDETTIALNSRSLMVMIALEGVSFETADVLDINALHRDINTLYKNISDERLALWTHLIRRRDKTYPDGRFKAKFSAQLNENYRQRMVSEDLFRNDLYLTVVWSPLRDPAEKAANLLSRLIRARNGDIEFDHEALKQLRDKVVDITAGLKRFEPRVLSLYDADGLLFPNRARSCINSSADEGSRSRSQRDALPRRSILIVLFSVGRQSKSGTRLKAALPGC